MLAAAWALIFITSFTLETASARKSVMKMGKCPSVRGVPVYANRGFHGTWYEYKRFPAPFESGQQCSKQVFEPDGSGLRVSIEGYLRINLFGESCIVSRHVVVGNATTSSMWKLSDFDISFGIYNLSNGQPNYFIVDTNFDEWAVVFSCYQFGDFNMQFAWILTRARGVPPQKLDKIEKQMDRNGIDLKQFHLVNQWNCPRSKK